MDVEFHYYITYLIAVAAGFDVANAKTIATASQYVDDNDQIVEVDKDLGTAYRNYISQTMNILNPKSSLMRIYPLFHFIPGDPDATTAHRKDGRMHWLNTTPNSVSAQAIFDRALATRDLYRIGIACHTYADTWAHQNFVGYHEPFNAMSGPLESCLPNIGHADAKHNPDWPGLVWRDKRLREERVDNNERFCAAAKAIFERLSRYATPSRTEGEISKAAEVLVADILLAIGATDPGNKYVRERTARYIQLTSKPQYGGVALSEYDPDLWFDEAVNEEVRGLRDRSDMSLTRYDPLCDHYTWKNRQSFQATDWYKFQEAVKAHQNEAWEVLVGRNFQGLDLPDL